LQSKAAKPRPLFHRNYRRAPRRTLLYVEDNPANMQLVEQLIARYPNIRLVTAVNGTLGIELAAPLSRR